MASSTTTTSRTCSKCNNELPKSAYSNNQWSKVERESKCKYCIASGGPPSSTINTAAMTSSPNEQQQQEQAAKQHDNVQGTSADDDTSYIGAIDASSAAEDQSSSSSPTQSKTSDIFYATPSGLSSWNAKMASLTQSVQSKDHDKLDKVSNVKLQKEDFKLRNDESEREGEEGDNLTEGGQKLDDNQVDEVGQAQHEGEQQQYQQQDTTTTTNNIIIITITTTSRHLADQKAS